MKWMLMLLAIWSGGACGAGFDALGQEFVHRLRPGETIWSVAYDFLAEPTRWRDLQLHNGIRRERALPPGTPVRIPVRWLRRVDLTIDVVRVSGTAYWSGSGSGLAPRPLATGARLTHGTRVITETQSVVTLRLPDGSMVQIAQGSEVSLRAQQLVGTNGSDVSVRVVRGRVETQVTPRTGQGSRYEIRTPAAQLGVRGTRFRVALSPDGKSTMAEVETGRVSASNHTLAGSAAVDLNAGFGTVVREGQPPLPPVALLPAVDLRSVGGLELGPDVQQHFDSPPGAVAFWVQLARDVDFQQVLTERLTPLPHYRFSVLPEGRYHLRVRAVDALGIEGLEARVTFTVRALDV